MTKMIRIIMILGVLFLIYQFFILFLVNNHESQYSLKTDDNAFMINEKYKKHGKFNMYYLKIKDKENNSFVASYNVGYNRQSHIIKDIKTYKNSDLYCVAPILKDKKIEYISCRQGTNQVSVSYLRQIGYIEVNDFIDSLKSQGYAFSKELDVENKITKTDKNISIYGNLNDNLYITMWGYKGLYILNKNKIDYKILLDKDLYFNNTSILVGKYYVVLDTTSDSVNSFYITNIKDGGKVKKDIDYSISKNIYINGIYNNKVYFTDVDNEKEYMINPASEKIEEVGSGNNGLYYDGKNLQKVNINYLISEQKEFITNPVNENLLSKNGSYNYIESYGNNYYQEGNNVYEVVGDYFENKILLFSFNNLKELKVINNNVFVIYGDTVYMYNNESGLNKVASNRELIYNYNNIYDIYIHD